MTGTAVLGPFGLELQGRTGPFSKAGLDAADKTFAQSGGV